MRAPPAFLRTRIARRVFGLFLLCAVLPTAVVATASYWMVTRELEEQARTQLRQAAKVSGTLLLSRLHEAGRALDKAADAQRTEAAPEAPLSSELREPFEAVVTAPAGGPSRAIFGSGMGEPGPFDEEQLSHLREGRTLLVTQPDGDATRLVLVRSLSEQGSPGLIYGVLQPQRLWEDEAEPLVPADTDFCVYPAGGGAPLYCSADPTGEGSAAAAEAGRAVIGESEVFLGFEFAAAPWTMRLARPLESFTAPLEFRRTVLLTLALGIWLVVFASNVMLRHRLDPVARLQEATRQVAAGDFSARVRLSTNDELQELGEAFNGMAERLREQFTLLGALHEVEQGALMGQTEGELARSALLQFPSLLPIDQARIVVRTPGTDRPDAAQVWRVGAGGSAVGATTDLPRSALAELDGTADHLTLVPPIPGPRLAHTLELETDRAHLVLPLREGGVSFAAVVLTAPQGESGFPEVRVRRARQVADEVALALANRRLVERLNAMSWGTLQALARSIDAVSPWTGGHSERVTRVAVAIGRQLELPPDRLDQLHRGGLLHDVGKIGVPPAILDKPGKLDDAEFAAIRAHPVIGARILEPIQAYEDVIPIVRHHHERFDGTGYPDRLAGRAIPYLARVLTVADVYDALVSSRPYREGWTPEAAVEYIEGRAGQEFDPEIVAAFLELVERPEWVETADAAFAVAATARGGQP